MLAGSSREPGRLVAARAGEQEAALAALAGIARSPRARARTVPGGLDDVAALLDEALPGRPASRPRPRAARGRLGAPSRCRSPSTARSTLTRWVDDLVVTVAGARRSLRLDPLLRRCEVIGGRLADPGTADARLEVGFRPDHSSGRPTC